MRHSQTHLFKTLHGNDTQSNINNCHIPVAPIVKEVNVYYKDDHFVGYLLKYQDSNIKTDGIVFEALFIPISHSEDKESKGIASRVTALEVSTINVIHILYIEYDLVLTIIITALSAGGIKNKVVVIL